MPKGKTIAITVANVTLLAPNKLNALIDLAIKTAVSARSLLDQAAMQCLLHTQKHGDVTPGARLLTGIRGTGFVVAALHKWFSDHSPIVYEWDKDKGQVVGKLLKEGEPGYKPFNTGAAEEESAFETAESKDRATREITPFSIGYVADRISKFRKTFKTYQIEGKPIVGNVEAIDAYLTAIEKASASFRATVVGREIQGATAIKAAMEQALKPAATRKGRKVTGNTDGASAPSVEGQKAVKAA